jgi:hypothetical protein
MKTLTESAFLAWADSAGLGFDPRYPHSAVLKFQADSGQGRFWEVPPEPECRPYFVLAFLELLGGWQHCHVWRHLGRWPDAAEPSRINDVVELNILKGLGLPLGTADVVTFDRSELDALVTLMFVTTIFGWSVAEDLYIVPDHARYVLQTDHHNVIHVAFRNPADVDEWVKRMDERGYSLPEDVPDKTFKQPDWMKGDG